MTRSSIRSSVPTGSARSAWSCAARTGRSSSRRRTSIPRERSATGLSVEVRRALAWIDYLPKEGDDAVFHTFAFLLDETGGTLGSLDPHERIAEYREVEPAEIAAVADRLDAIASAPSPDIVGDWADWGRFRAVVHRAVAEAL